MKETVAAIDDAVDNWADKFRGIRIVDAVAKFFSVVAEFAIAWQIVGLIALVATDDFGSTWLRIAITLAIDSVLVNQVIKRITNRPRPKATDKLSYKIRRPSTTSLPSGHASSATVGAILLTFAFGHLVVLWTAIALLVMWSRVHNRVHHFSDVLGGVVAGASIAACALVLWPI